MQWDTVHKRACKQVDFAKHQQICNTCGCLRPALITFKGTLVALEYLKIHHVLTAGHIIHLKVPRVPQNLLVAHFYHEFLDSSALVALEYLKIHHPVYHTCFSNFSTQIYEWSTSILKGIQVSLPYKLSFMDTSSSSNSSSPKNGLHAVYSGFFSGSGNLSLSVQVIILKPWLAVCYPLSDYKP